MDSQWENGCNRAAVRANEIAESLFSISLSVPEYRNEIRQVVDALNKLEFLLDRLLHEVHEYHESVPIVQTDLVWLLGAVQGSLETMRYFINGCEVWGGPQRTWENMRDRMKYGIGSPINTRFSMCNEFIELILEKLRRLAALRPESCHD